MFLTILTTQSSRPKRTRLRLVVICTTRIVIQPILPLVPPPVGDSSLLLLVLQQRHVCIITNAAPARPRAPEGAEASVTFLVS